MLSLKGCVEYEVIQSEKLSSFIISWSLKSLQLWMPEAEAPRVDHCCVCLVHFASAALWIKNQTQKLSAISFLSQCKYLKIIISPYWKYLAPVLWLHHLHFLQFHSRLPVLFYYCLVSMTK